jgi:hypothetical protein
MVNPLSLLPQTHWEKSHAKLYHKKMLIAEGLSFGSLARRIYDCKLRNEKKYLMQVLSEFSPQRSKLVA